LGEPSTVKRLAPRTLGDSPVPHELTVDRHTVHAELFVAVLPGARVLGPDGVVITPDGRVIAESTWPRCYLPRGRAWTALMLPRPTAISGQVYTIASAGAGGYYH